MLPLRRRQKLFVKEYLIDLNATQAAIRAGYSKKTAKDIGAENLAKPHIAHALQQEMNARAAKIDLTAEKVLKDIDTIKQDAMRPGEDGYIVDRQAALRACELEGKHLKMFTDKVDMTLDGVVELEVGFETEV